MVTKKTENMWQTHRSRIVAIVVAIVVVLAVSYLVWPTDAPAEAATEVEATEE